jgi:hypothetical protein
MLCEVRCSSNDKICLTAKIRVASWILTFSVNAPLHIIIITIIIIIVIIVNGGGGDTPFRNISAMVIDYFLLSVC